MNKIAFFDIDGTLLVDKEKHINPQVIEALNDLSLDVTKMIATGRNYKQAKQYIDIVNPDSYICSNGQLAVYKGIEIHCHYMPRQQIDDLIKYYQSENIQWAYETSNRIYLANGESTDQIAQMIQGYGILDVEISEEHLDDGVFQMWAFGTKQEMDKIEPYLVSKYNTIRWGENSIEIVCDGQSKANAISKIVEYIGSEVTTYAFGDGLNDMEMLSKVDHSVAMGNAHPKLKEVATHVTDNCEDLGIIKGLELVGLK